MIGNRKHKLKPSIYYNKFKTYTYYIFILIFHLNQIEIELLVK